VDEADWEVIEVKILNHERGEVVGTIDTDGNLEMESEALRNISQECFERCVPVFIPRATRARTLRRFTPTMR
jgi:hypothetical protein